MYGDGADFGQVNAIEVERAAADDFGFVFDDQEVANVLTDFGEAAREQGTVSGVDGDQIVYLLGVRQDGFTRVHGPPLAGTQFCSLHPELLASLEQVQYRRERREWLRQIRESGRNRNRR